MRKFENDYILTIRCPNRVGIVAAISSFLAERDWNIINSAQFDDLQTGLFFMRLHFVNEQPSPRSQEEVEQEFAEIGERFGMDWHIYDTKVKPRVLIMVSQFGHCLNDLLYRYSIGALPMEIPAIVSNHRDFYQLAASHNIPYHHLPVTRENKAAQEARLMQIVEQERVDLVVLARYMQILSNELCTKLEGRAINIHHSFLPSFKGAKPYHQAHARGVKRIGATAHYVTGDLDEGPIIEQEVAPVHHAMTPEDLVGVGRDIESLVLARAVRNHIEHRVLIDGNKTVVFSR